MVVEQIGREVIWQLAEEHKDEAVELQSGSLGAGPWAGLALGPVLFYHAMYPTDLSQTASLGRHSARHTNTSQMFI
jgi:hypothetical protein